jgi:hypothetical protein
MDQQPYDSITDLCTALRGVGIHGAICEELETVLTTITERYGGAEFILKHGLAFWADQILQDGRTRVHSFKNGCFMQPDTVTSSSTISGSVSGGTSAGNEASTGGEASMAGSAGGGGSASAGVVRSVVFVTNPTIPLDGTVHLDLPPMVPLETMQEETECPEKIVFYHGCPWPQSLLSIRDHGVSKGQRGGYYSPLPATYWSTSSAFAVWWCATLRAKDEAIVNGIWRSLSNKERGALKRDTVPDALNEVKCLVVTSQWTKVDLYKMFIYILDSEEEDEVRNRNERSNTIDLLQLTYSVVHTAQS